MRKVAQFLYTMPLIFLSFSSAFACDQVKATNILTNGSALFTGTVIETKTDSLKYWLPFLTSGHNTLSRFQVKEVMWGISRPTKNITLQYSKKTNTPNQKVFQAGTEDTLLIHKNTPDGYVLSQMNQSEGLVECIKEKGLDFSKQNFDGRDIKNINFENLEINNSSFSKANLSGSRLTNTSFSYVDFKKANLQKVNLKGALFQNVDFNGVDLSEASLENADFKSVFFMNAILDGANLKGADFSALPFGNFENISMENAIFDQNTMWPTGFLPQKHGAKLEESSLKLPENILVNKNIYARDTQNEGLNALLELENEGVYMLDGMKVKGYRRVSLINDKENIIRVVSNSIPGKAYKYKGGQQETPFKSIRIEGDAGIDRVILDGCFKWNISNNLTTFSSSAKKNKSGAPSFSTKARTYVSASESGQQVEVLIQNGLKVSFSKECSSEKTKNIEHSQDQNEWKEPFSEKKNQRIKLLKEKALSLEKYWAKNSPPNSMFLPEPHEGTATCAAGHAIYKDAGVYQVQVPKGCNTIYVKAWGAGGERGRGGPGGFTAGVIKIPEEAGISAIVGSSGRERGRDDTKSGNTVLSIDGNPTFVAGGGGNHMTGFSFGHPGGGRDVSDIDLHRKQGGKNHRVKYSKDDYNAGVGLVPEYGITVWGRANGHLPANVDDLYHPGFAGRAGHDGTIAIMWPAPDPEKFFEIVAKHTSDLNPFVKEMDQKKKPQKAKSPYQSAFESSMKGPRGIALRSRILKEKLELQEPEPYGVNDALNISVYEHWLKQSDKENQEVYSALLNLMKAKKIPTEFLVSGTEYSIDRRDNVLKPLSENGFVELEVSDENQKVNEVSLGSHGKKMFFKSGWKEHKTRLQCNTIYKGRPIYAYKHQSAFGGIGVGSRVWQNKIKILRVLPGTPADLSGLNAGQIITAIDGVKVKEIPAEKAFEKMRGAVGSTIDIEFTNPDNPEIIRTVSLKRQYLSLGQSKSPDILFKTDMITTHTHDNILMFGEGIFPSDMYWENGRRLVNKKTKDSIEFSSEACADFIFKEDGEFLNTNLYKDAEAFSSYSEIPSLIIRPRSIRANEKKERFLHNLKTAFNRKFKDTQAVNSAALEKKKQEILKAAKKTQRMRLLSFDDNLDGQISKSELDFSKNSPHQGLSLIAKPWSLSDFDIDKNNVISHDEMVTLSQAEKKRLEDRVSKSYQSYIDLDQNDDGMLTVEEFSALAEKVFTTIDIDRNDILSAEEISKYKEALSRSHLK